MDGATELAFICFIVSFITTLFLTKVWIRAAKTFGLVGKDMNKINGRLVAEEGGIAVLFGLLAGIFVNIFFKTFYLNSDTHLTILFAVISALLFAGFIGFIDGILGWKKGLKQWQKPLLSLPIAIPLMILDAGHSNMTLPVFGPVYLGIVYPLILIPLGIIGASNGFNMLAGMNGLEAGLGTIMLSALGIIAFISGTTWLALIAFLAVASLMAFLVFNRYPSRVFPGDALTYSIGALVAILAILGDMEKVALILFIPYFIELLLKARYRFKIESFGTPQPDGTLKVPEKAGSLTHIYARLFKTEKSTVRALLATEILIAIIAILTI